MTEEETLVSDIGDAASNVDEVELEGPEKNLPKEVEEAAKSGNLTDLRELILSKVCSIDAILSGA